MSRWNKNIVVPLDSGKENTNRPTVSHSLGTVGKWGKMGFTSTRTYTMSALPAAVAAAAAAVVAASPQKNSNSQNDCKLLNNCNDVVKPRKFFKSRNTAPPEVIAQIIQQLPRQSNSPPRENNSQVMANMTSVHNTPIKEPIKVKISKTNLAERKKKTPRKIKHQINAESGDEEASDEGTDHQITPIEIKTIKKKKISKELKPEAPPLRVLSRARKTINYCEDDEEDHSTRTLKESQLLPKHKRDIMNIQETPPLTPAHRLTDDVYGNCSTLIPTDSNTNSNNQMFASKTPEHPPIVLRISKGTSRLVSTDSEEQPNVNSIAQYQAVDTDIEKNLPAEVVEPLKLQLDTKELHNTVDVRECERSSNLTVRTSQPSPLLLNASDDQPEINYCTVKISPDKPPKERLKLIIKTDVVRNALAAASSFQSASVSKTTEITEKTVQGESDIVRIISNNNTDRSDKEKLRKSKKHKIIKQANEQLAQPIESTLTEFKTPSPHLALCNNVPQDYQQQQQVHLSAISPSAFSERDFDSQSSVLGSTSSKCNSTPCRIPHVVEESCVLYSRGSSVITSDLETSQHSSLVAPPSEIELRLESMMMDGDGSQQPIANTYLETEPLEEDILAVLRGDEETANEMEQQIDRKINGLIQKDLTLKSELKASNGVTSAHRTTRGRTKINTDSTLDDYSTPATRTRQKKALDNTGAQLTLEESTNLEENNVQQRRTSRRNKKTTDNANKLPLTVNETVTDITTADNSTTLTEVRLELSTELNSNEGIIMPKRKGRVGRSSNNNSNLIGNSNDNSNINKIAANLSAKAGAAELLKGSRDINRETTTVPAMQRSYGRKRKNQQVTQVLQQKLSPEMHKDCVDDGVAPPKLANLEIRSEVDNIDDQINNKYSKLFEKINSQCVGNNYHQSAILTMDNDSNSMNSNYATHSQRDDRSESSPKKDYLFKDKFKRTLTLDATVNNTMLEQISTAQAITNDGTTNLSGSGEPAVKLVISKKKGSIFKSRVPSEQTEQPGGKRHLYRHRWNADANGDITNENDTTSGIIANENHNKILTSSNTKAIDAIYNDFNIEESDSNSALFPKVNKVVKQNNITTATTSSLPFGTNCDPTQTGLTSTSSRIEQRNAKSKNFYTVVSNVKSAHQIQEIGEYQEMDDDVEYILDALQHQNPLSTRCLSALQLATKCMVPAFRMHVRAHGIVTKFFKALSDANQDLSLGLCTSAIMYILSQEGLNMDLDRDSLELMINLLESERSAAEPADHVNYERNKQKVRELCEEIKAQRRGIHLNVDAITVGTLAMETLLSLTSKRAGEWFKEELRQLGGLEHIIRTINECSRSPIEKFNCTTGIDWTRPLLDNMQTIERCLRVLENVTQMNEDNQRYIIMYDNGVAVNTLCSLYKLCCREIVLHPSIDESVCDKASVIIREVLIPLIKVLINLTHPFTPTNTLGAEKIGQEENTIDISFYVLLQVPNYIPDRCVFEFSILALLLLINLTTYTLSNRKRIMHTQVPEANFIKDNGNNLKQRHSRNQSAISAILSYFYKCEELARLVEKNTDAFLDNQDKSNKKKQEEVDETVNNLLQKAGHHMEHSLKGSYTAILIGHLITDNEQYENIVREHLRGNGFKEIVSVLEKYYNFMNLTGSSEASVMAHIRSTKKLLDYFKKRDLVYTMNEEENSEQNMASLNLETDQPQDELDKRKTYDKSCYYKDKTDLNLMENYTGQSTTITTQRVFETCN